MLLWLASAAAAQPLPPASVVAAIAERTWRGGARVELTITRAVPWRVAVRGNPWRLILDTSEVDWSGLDPAALEMLGPVVAGRADLGWSRLVVALPGPARLTRGWLDTSGAAPVIRLALADGADPDALPADWSAAPVAPVPLVQHPRQDGMRPLVVALDPGHGGVDPGAVAGGVNEADLMLGFARELAEMLRAEGHSVVLTREGDGFVGLRGRTSVARAGGADLLISLHADAVRGGGADGATVYTLAEGDGDAIAAEIAQRQDRDDLVLGAGPVEAGDEIARLLVDLARRETQPRSSGLADALVRGLGAAGIKLHKRPRLGGRFTVLKAPDIPSVLLELGFMSDPGDLANLASPGWRSAMAAAILRSVEDWRQGDAAQAELLRR